MKISINANRCEPSPMRKFHPLAVQAEKNGKTIFHLNIGQPDIKTPEAFYDAVRAFDRNTLAYAESPGMPLLIDAVRKYYSRIGVNLEPDDVLITTGGSEALLLTCLSILDPYTEVIIPEPYYPSYTTFVHAAGGRIRALPTCPEEGYGYADRKRIEQAAPARRKSKKAAANETSADTAPSNESSAADNQKTASEEAPSVQFKAKDAQRKNDSGKNNAPARTNARADDIKPKYSGLADLLAASGLIGKAPDRPV